MKIGFLGLLAILFIGLKLTGFIAWSWWWVLAPLWLPLAIFISIAGIIFAIVGIATLVSGKKPRIKYKGW